MARRRVLLVGGDPQVTAVLSEHLRRGDSYEIESFDYCDDALMVLQRQPFDLVLVLSFKRSLEDVAQLEVSGPAHRQRVRDPVPQQMRVLPSPPRVIVVSDWRSCRRQAKEEALANGAFALSPQAGHPRPNLTVSCYASGGRGAATDNATRTAHYSFFLTGERTSWEALKRETRPWPSRVGLGVSRIHALLGGLTSASFRDPTLVVVACVSAPRSLSGHLTPVALGPEVVVDAHRQPLGKRRAVGKPHPRPGSNLARSCEKRYSPASRRLRGHLSNVRCE